MAQKKKQNPNRIPLSMSESDLNEIKIAISNKMVLRAWALVLAAISSYYDTTTEILNQIWHKVNQYSTTIHNYQDAKTYLQKFKASTGVEIKCEPLVIPEVHTYGDLRMFQRRMSQFAKSMSLAIISEPMLTDSLLPIERIGEVFRKAMDLDQEIEEGRISITDISDMLKDEYGVLLEEGAGGKAYLSLINKTKSE